jgi:hypothetical protein
MMLPVNYGLCASAASIPPVGKTAGLSRTTA